MLSHPYTFLPVLTGCMIHAVLRDFKDILKKKAILLHFVLSGIG